MSRYLRAGAKVCRGSRKMPKGKGMSYRPACGVLLEDARVGPDAGWDVYDIRLPSGKETSAYGFDLKPGRKPRKKSRRR